MILTSKMFVKINRDPTNWKNEAINFFKDYNEIYQSKIPNIEDFPNLLINYYNNSSIEDGLQLLKASLVDVILKFNKSKV